MIDKKMDDLQSRLFAFAKDSDVPNNIQDTCHEAAITICGLLDTVHTVEAERDEALERIAKIENILGDDYDLDRLSVLMSQRMTMREDVATRIKLVGNIPLEHLRDIVGAYRDGRCFLIPKDKTVYYVEEAFGCKWIESKEIKDIVILCEGGVFSPIFSLFDTGKYFSYGEADAALHKDNRYEDSKCGRCEENS